MIKGITVYLHVKTPSTTDDFGKQLYTEEVVAVDNVLVAPASDSDIVNDLNLYGKKAVYTLAIPKGDAHNWKDTTVEFFGKVWRTYGEGTEGIEENIPLKWNKKVKVEAYG